MVRAKQNDAEGGNKTLKDPNRPKKALSAYFLWLKENRAELAKDGSKVTEVSKKAGVLWRGMTAEDKVPWEKKAAKDKERYAAEMAAYSRK